MTHNGVKMHLCSGPGLDQFFSEFRPDVVFHEVPVRGKGKWKDYVWTKDLLQNLEVLLKSQPDIEIVIVRYGTSNAFAFLPLMRRFPNHTWIFEVNSLFVHQPQASKIPHRIRQLIFVLERYVVGSADLVYVVASGLKKQLTGHARAIAKEKVLVIPNAGNADLVEARKCLPVSQNGSICGRKFAYLGVFQNYYEFDIVAEAFRRVQRAWRDAELHLFGYGGDEDEVRAMFKSVPNVIFHGKFDLNSLVETGTFDENWILLLPYAEQPIAQVGSPTKMFEYMAIGLPIIASRLGQLPEILQEGDFAFFYEPGNIESLTDAMDEACKSTHLPMMGYAAQQAFLAKHTWFERMATFLEQIQNHYRS